MSEYISKDFSNFIKNDVNFTFTKFGDGEYSCMNFHNGSNCDDDLYTKWLGEELIKSFKNLSSLKDVYIGKWHTKTVVDFFENLTTNKINWVDYHSVMNASPIGNSQFDSFSNDHLLEFVKSIRDTNRKKIILSNIKNIKMMKIFKCEKFIEVPDKNWSFNYYDYEQKLINELQDNCIILTAAGMCSKVIISNLLRINNNITCIDLGSGFDLLATGMKSRSWQHSYEDELKYYSSLNLK